MVAVFLMLNETQVLVARLILLEMIVVLLTLKQVLVLMAPLTLATCNSILLLRDEPQLFKNRSYYSHVNQRCSHENHLDLHLSEMQVLGAMSLTIFRYTEVIRLGRCITFNDIRHAVGRSWCMYN